MRALRWPLPALAAWAGCWAVFSSLAQLGAGAALAFLAATLAGAALASTGATPWRRIFIGCGFPASLAASGVAAALPAWSWLLPLALLAFVYPVHAWRDAPVFPTSRGALRGLAATLPLRDGSRALDAGCGLGHALVELRREFPRTTLAGIEWSWPLCLVCALRCRFARVARGDMWRIDWSEFDLVYIFQRPESTSRAAAKARAELKPGAWLASLEFEVAGWPPTAVFRCADERPLWLYRMSPERK